MRYPKFLPDQGSIGFVAPSFGCAIEPYKSAFANALKKFEAEGYRTVLGPNVYKEDGLGISSTPENCGAELNEAYCSEESDILISCGGGELMCEVIPHMDFEAMKKAEPKWYLGYSDNTNFVFFSATILDTAAIYGPCAGSFGMEPWHPAIQDAFDLLRGRIEKVHNYELWEREGFKDAENPLVPYNVTEKTLPRIFDCEGGKAKEVTESVLANASAFTVKGRLLGGCLDSMANFVGTRFDQVNAFHDKYGEEGILWFFEACDLNVMSIRRAVWQLKEAGWFDKVSAFLVGRPLCFGEEAFGLDQYHAVTDILEEFGVPIIMDLDIGHLPPQMPVIVGATAEARVKNENGACSFEMEYTWE